MSEIVFSSEIKRRRRTTKIDKRIIWSRDTTAKLISTVEEYPVLWNTRCSEYRDLMKRTAAWQRIEEVFNHEIPFEQLKKKWQLLCQTHSKKVIEHNTSKSGQAAKKKIAWEHWTAMQFMRQTKNDYQTVSASNLVLSQSTQLLEESESTDNSQIVEDPLKHFVFEDNESTSSTQKTYMRCAEEAIHCKRVRSQTPSDSNINNLRMKKTSAIKSMLVNESTATSLQSPDKYDEFGKYVSSTLRQMPLDFVDRAMAEMHLCLSKLNLEAATLRLQRARENQKDLDVYIDSKMSIH